MKFFLDTADVEAIRKYAEMGLVDGITTNPSLILKSGRDHKEVISEIGKIVDGPISVEGVGKTAEEMVKDAKEYKQWINNMVAKVPMTPEGLKAVRILKKEGIPTNVTLVFSASQALLVAKAGGTFVSPFIGRLDDNGVDGIDLIEDIAEIYENYGFETQILAASIRSVGHVKEAALAGAHIATLPPKIMDKMFKHVLTDSGIARFEKDYQESLKFKK